MNSFYVNLKARKKRKKTSDNPMEKIRIISSVKDSLNLILIWSLLTSAGPFMLFLAIPGHPYKILIALGLAIASFFLFLKGKLKNPDKAIIIILISQAFLIVFPFSFFHGDVHQFAYVAISIQYIAILILYVYVHNFYSIPKMAKSLVYFMTLMTTMGSIVAVLGLIGLIDIFSTHQNPDGRTAYNFILTFSNSVVPIGNSLIIRIAGFFDEPGTFAYYITFTLLINKIYGFSKTMEWMLIIGGLFTLSLAFNVTVVLYIFFFYGNWKQFKYFLLGLMIISSFFLYIDNFRYSSPVNSMIYNLTLGRLEVEKSSSGNSIVTGDNRSRLFVRAFEAFKDSPFIGQGIRHQEDINSKFYKQHFGSNLFGPLGEGGIIGATITFLAFFYWTYLVFARSDQVNRRMLISSWTIITINFLQRPALRGFFTYFVMILLIEATKFYLIYTNKNRQKQSIISNT
jgi:hypothetical protein